MQGLNKVKYGFPSLSSYTRPTPHNTSPTSTDGIVHNVKSSNINDITFLRLFDMSD